MLNSFVIENELCESNKRASENIEYRGTFCLRSVMHCFPSMMIDFVTASSSRDHLSTNIIAAIVSIVVENNRLPYQPHFIYYGKTEICQ